MHVWVFFCKKGDCITFWKKKIYEEAGEEKSITIFLYLEPNLHPSLKKIVKSPDVFPIYFYSKQLTTFPLTKIILRKMSVLFAEKNSLIQCILRIFSPFVPKCSMLFHKKILIVTIEKFEEENITFEMYTYKMTYWIRDKPR